MVKVTVGDSFKHFIFKCDPKILKNHLLFKVERESRRNTSDSRNKNAFVSTPTSNEMVAFSAPSLLSHTVTYPRAHDKQKT